MVHGSEHGSECTGWQLLYVWGPSADSVRLEVQLH